MIRALLFDFDGTLADSFPGITLSVNHVRVSHGLPELSEATVKESVGHGLERLVERLVPGLPTAEAIRRYREHHAGVMISGTRLFDGVPETLAELARRGTRLGVCSNKSVHFTRPLVAGLGLGQFFPVVLGPEDVGAAKPDPAMILEGLARLKVSKSEAVYIGDMAVDVRTARAAGLPVWIMPGGAAGEESAVSLGPDHLLRDFREILELLE